MRTYRPIVALLAAFALVTGCTVKDTSTDTKAGSGSIKPIKGLSSQTIAVGSKEFDEQLVLGNIAILALQAAGAKTKDKTNITGSDNVRKALTGHQIDLYWEYTGTAWVSYLKHDNPISNPHKLYNAVKKADAKNGITWWAPSPANNTYAIAANPAVAKATGVKTLSDYAKLVKSNPKKASTCIGPEFRSRNDGFPGLAKAYGFKLPKAQQQNVGDSLIYNQVGKGKTCAFGEVATTDGRIKAQHLVVLKDDKKFFPVYNPAITIDSKLAKKYPGLEKPFTAIANKLTQDTLLSLNQKVSVNAQDPKKVAHDWMKQEGFIG